MAQPFTFTPDDIKSPWNSTPDGKMLSLVPITKISPVASTPDTSDSSCSCFLQAVSTYEAIEVAVWGTKRAMEERRRYVAISEKGINRMRGASRVQKMHDTVCLHNASLIYVSEDPDNIGGSYARVRSWGGSVTMINQEHGPEDRKRRKGTAMTGEGTDESRSRGYGISIRRQAARWRWRASRSAESPHSTCRAIGSPA